MLLRLRHVSRHRESIASGEASPSPVQMRFAVILWHFLAPPARGISISTRSSNGAIAPPCFIDFAPKARMMHGANARGVPQYGCAMGSSTSGGNTLGKETRNVA